MNIRRFSMAIKTIASAILACVLVSACISNGHKFDTTKVDQLQPGTTTLQDATAMFGKPRSESTYANGSKLIQWIYMQASPAGSETNHLAVLFDGNGKMVRIVEKSGF
jgi:outer membrane protein assembly factor BamE (lipoprotein component of BamABCDE complex)